MSKKKQLEEELKVEEVKITAEDIKKSESGSQTVSNPPTSPKPTLKITYRDLFAKEASRISGKEFKGDPTLEAVNGHPLLQKYYQNWLNCEAE